MHVLKITLPFHSSMTLLILIRTEKHKIKIWQFPFTQLVVRSFRNWFWLIFVSWKLLGIMGSFRWLYVVVICKSQFALISGYSSVLRLNMLTYSAVDTPLIFSPFLANISSCMFWYKKIFLNLFINGGNNNSARCCKR